MAILLKKPHTSPPEKIIVTDYKYVNSGNGWDLLLRCPNSQAHNNNDDHWSCRGNSSESRTHCVVCGFSANFWDKSKMKNKRIIEETYYYRDEKKTLLYQVVRFKPKDFRQRRPDPDKPGEFIWNLNGVRRVLYKLPRLLKFTNSTIHLLEGEKAVNRFTKFGFLATTCAGGAGKWLDEYNIFFKSRNVVAYPDHDDIGRNHMRSVATQNICNAKSFKIVTLPGLAETEGADDWLDKIEAMDSGGRNLTKKEVVEELKGYIKSEVNWEEKFNF